METFVVRLRRETHQGDPPELHGVVEHVGDERTTTFKDQSGLIDFLIACLGPRESGGLSGGDT